MPRNPRLNLDALDTYYVTVPSICECNELYVTRGKQQVKIEFMFCDKKHSINRIKQPKLFALETKKEFNVLALESLFADKLTTLGPNTIGIPEDRADEQMKQIYDVITLFLENRENLFKNKELVILNYKKVAKEECEIHNILYNFEKLLEDMKGLINSVKHIELNNELQQRAKDFQSLYLRRLANRTKSKWAIVGFQLGVIVDLIFSENSKDEKFYKIEELINKLQFKNIRGPERSRKLNGVRDALKTKFGLLEGPSENLFRKTSERIIWELINFVTIEEIIEATNQLSE